MQQPDLTITLPNTRLVELEAELKQHGFDSSQPIGTITQQGVEVEYALTVPEQQPGYSDLALTITKHGFIPKSIIIARLREMILQSPA
jgi:hypothetical protein